MNVIVIFFIDESATFEILRIPCDKIDLNLLRCASQKHFEYEYEELDSIKTDYYVRVNKNGDNYIFWSRAIQNEDLLKLISDIVMGDKYNEYIIKYKDLVRLESTDTELINFSFGYNCTRTIV